MENYVYFPALHLLYDQVFSAKKNIVHHTLMFMYDTLFCDLQE